MLGLVGNSCRVGVFCVAGLESSRVFSTIEDDDIGEDSGGWFTDGVFCESSASEMDGAGGG